MTQDVEQPLLQEMHKGAQVPEQQLQEEQRKQQHKDKDKEQEQELPIKQQLQQLMYTERRIAVRQAGQAG
ncbi:hypothetical protein GPECTOR_56g425 [Gonium pectorale]|uniref:Uncharacterized protein n=1 Tax=Gonium pectorale TaxID=33097 RepID=A0A150G679_GONPE|nr:hypothetical protein GPECTOR_56g425 [Gonium pectorale]|eukprot:KXZ45328.1 hypothetical protein GPECTOR_56g425 [Gonium pectorale]